MTPEHWSWTPEFRTVIAKYMSQVQRYGYVTDYEEVAYELGRAVLVLSHVLPMDSIDDPLGLTMIAELTYNRSFRKRRALIRNLRYLYAREIGQKEEARRRKQTPKKRRTRSV